MLAGHEESDHHVRDLNVRDRCAIFVGAGHEVPDHVILIPLFAAVAPGLDDFRVCLRHSVLRVVAFSVVRQRRPGEHEVYWGEAHVEVVVEVGEAGVEPAADFFALEGARGGVDGEFCECGGNVEGAGGAFEVRGALEEVDDFVCD